MGRLFCYTLSARAIGATVSAGALHAQGWGFESLIAHHLNDKASSNGGLSLGPSQRDSNPSGCGAEETRKRFPAQHARREAPQRKRAAPAARDIPHRPPLNWKRSSKGDRFCLGPSHGIRTRKGAELRKRVSVFQRSTRGAERRSGSGQRNGPLANTRVQKMPNMSTATFLMAAFSKS